MVAMTSRRLVATLLPTALMLGIMAGWGTVAATAVDAYDPPEVGKQHSVIGGQRVQPKDAHVRSRVERMKRARKPAGQAKESGAKSSGARP